MDDFLWRALAGGIGVALVAGPLGCFVVWRKLAYFGDTLSHAALLGVALGYIAGIDLFAGVLVVLVVVALLLALGERRQTLSGDTLLGILSHSTLALGLVAIGWQDRMRVDLTAYLFGDILSVTPADLVWIWAGGAVALAGLVAIWRPLLSATVHAELAQIEGVRLDRVRIVFLLLIAVVVTVAIKVVGVLLITALLILPAATARRFAHTPEAMAVGAAAAGVVAVALGLAGSLALDTPSGPSVVVAAAGLFAATRLLPGA